MARSAKRPERRQASDSSALAAVAALGGVVARNPTLVGGSTAFLVALSFVSANALWYQPYAHPGAFFSTRAIERDGFETPLPETTIRIERPEQTSAPRQIDGDPVTKAVQAVLKELNLYQGSVDGLSGPNTRKAVEAYQKTVGLPITGVIDKALLEQLDPSTTSAITPRPRPEPAKATNEPSPARFEGKDSSAAERISKIQAGLREFGHKDIKVDGVMGTRTRAAISEFQAIFGLKQTGEPDEAVYAKMRKEKLIQ